MKMFLILICLQLLKAVICSQGHRAGYSPLHSLKHNKHLHGYKERFVVNHHSKRPRPRTRPHLNKALFTADTEAEQDSILERMSPEYKYNNEYGQNVAKVKGGTSKIFNDKLAQDLPYEDYLESVEQKSTRAAKVGGLGIPMGIGRENSLEELNVMLQNTLPEYQYDKPAHAFDSCVDLDPDCRRYEMQGLCSDNPNFAAKRFNCKRTCHLCTRRLSGRLAKSKTSQLNKVSKFGRMLK